MSDKRLLEDRQAVAMPLEFLAVFSVILIAFVMVLATINTVFVPYQTSNEDLSAVAMEVSEMLLKSTGNTVSGNSNWEYDPDNLAYMGLGCDIISAVYFDSSGAFASGTDTGSGSDGKFTPVDPDALVVDAGGPYYGSLGGFHIGGLTITLNGSASNGVPLYNFVWSIVDSVTGYPIDDPVLMGSPSSGTGDSLDVTFYMSGTYFANLSVTDSAGNVSSDIALIVISSGLGGSGSGGGWISTLRPWLWDEGDPYENPDPENPGYFLIWINYGPILEADLFGDTLVDPILFGDSSQGGDSSSFGGMIGSGDGTSSFSYTQGTDDTGDIIKESSSSTVHFYTAKDGDSGEFYVSKVEYCAATAIYGRVDMDKISALRNGLVSYDKVKESLGLSKETVGYVGLDVNILITSFDGTVLLNYGVSPVGRNVVSSYSRNVDVFDGVESIPSNLKVTVLGV